MDYYSQVQKLEKILDTDIQDADKLSAIQSKLNGMIIQYRDDDSLESDRYALYQLQAMLSYRQGDFGKASRFIDYAVYIRGEDFQLAMDMRNQLMKLDFEPKAERKWWLLIIAPLCGLVVVALLQFIVHFVLAKTSTDTAASTSSPLTTTLNIFSITVGVICVLLVFLIPIWIIELRRAQKYNSNHGYSVGLKKKTGVLLAIFLPTWYWYYTYQTDSGKFWLNFLLALFSRGYWQIVNWPWAIIVATRRPDDFYILYPFYDQLPKADKA
jgi:hypothetical protein